MISTLLTGVTQKDFDFVVQQNNTKSLYYPTLFPVVEKQTLNFNVFENVATVTQAGDIVARGASIRPADRPVHAIISGEIPKIAVKRIMDENVRTEYDIAMAMAKGDANAQNVISMWADDVTFCHDAVQARVECMALQTASLGRIRLTTTNNNGTVTEQDVDYQVLKSGYLGAAGWDVPATAQPISVDLKQGIANGRKKGHYYKYIFMNTDTFAKFAQCAEVIKLCSSYVATMAGVSLTPSLETVNTTLKTLPFLYGVQIIVIDQIIREGNQEGAGNPFADNTILFSETPTLGNTYSKTPVDMSIDSPIIMRAMSGIVCIKKFAIEEPLSEITMGIANAIPVWRSSTTSMLMDVKNNSWNEGQ